MSKRKQGCAEDAQIRVRTEEIQEMHTLRLSRETKKTCVILILAALLLVAVGSCAGVMVFGRDVAAIEAEEAERETIRQSAVKTAPLTQRSKETGERELPKELLAVEEAYTPAAEQEPPVRTVDVNGQEMELVTATESVGMTSLGAFRVTHYCPCVQCCGKSDGITKSGRPVVPYYSIAVDPSVIPLGTVVYLDYGDGVLHEARADDTGGAINGNVIDLCVGDHQTAIQYGVRQAIIYRRANNETDT